MTGTRTLDNTRMIEVCDKLNLAELRMHKARAYGDGDFDEALDEVNALKAERRRLADLGHPHPDPDELPSVRAAWRRQQKAHQKTRQGILEATPYRLRSGEWGARVKHADGSKPAEGDKIKVTARSGKTWTAEIARVVWSNKAVSLVATAPKNGNTRRRSYARRGRSYRGPCEHGHPHTDRNPCPTCFDEF